MRVNSPNLPRGGRRRAFRPVFFLAVVTLLALSGCGTPAMLRPASISSTRVADLTWAILYIAAFVFVIVEALLLYSAFRYRHRPGMGLPRQITGNAPLEIGWTAFPAIVLAIVFALTLGTLRSVSSTPVPPQNAGQPQATLNVRVIGHQWWWEFQYPDQKIVTANELHIPVNTTVSFSVESVDVIHSFWVPELGGKMDAIPGRVNSTWYRATKTGTFYGQCAEFCGQEHALMALAVFVDTQKDFDAWVANQQAPVAQPAGAAAQGYQLFLSRPCGSCHMINGIQQAQGKVGPNLTHFGSRSKFAGEIFESTPDTVAKWLENPQAMKPGTLMPNLGLTHEQATQLAVFLRSLK